MIDDISVLPIADAEYDGHDIFFTEQKQRICMVSSGFHSVLEF